MPNVCSTKPAKRLCAIHTHVRAVNKLRTRMDKSPIKYGWLAEKYPARRDKLLKYWTKQHRHTKHVYKTWRKAQAQQNGIPANIKSDFLCIHHYEGAWNANTGNGYYGGLQMDYSFQSSYGPEYLRTYGTADKWPPSDQLIAAYRAYKTRGFTPWPNTARYCGLL